MPEAPETPYDQVLAIIRRVLRVDTIDLSENFFNLGAPSLAMIQIMDLIEQECGVQMNILEVFDAKDIDSFVKAAAARTAAG